LTVTTTLTGLVVPDGRATSGIEYEPVGLVGDATPATDVIVTLGRFTNAGRLAVVTGPGGVTIEGLGVMVLSIVPVTKDSRRIFPY
jgi:hypothetical protein